MVNEKLFVNVYEKLSECVFTRGQRLFELLGLLLVGDDECVQVSAAAHLKLHIVLVLLDLNSYTHTHSHQTGSDHGSVMYRINFTL